ncbi:MAG: 50S ribosomal protein L9 [Acidobacteria bacterium]|jgi:large subunit ribosomal protein L9|nr:50S ribosomal protein L9 [Acidobacteriota bacterium]
MATTKILLREDIDSLGGRGEIVKVKAGYARNFLLPNRLASLATKGNINQIEKERTALLNRASVERSAAIEQAEQMKDVSLSFKRRAGEGGALFGSVTSMDIAEALKAQGFEIDRRKINLKDAIKETGDFTVNVKLHREITLQVPVIIRTEDGGGAPVEKTVDSANAQTETSSAATADETENTATPETSGEAES